MGSLELPVEIYMIVKKNYDICMKKESVDNFILEIIYQNDKTYHPVFLSFLFSFLWRGVSDL